MPPLQELLISAGEAGGAGLPGLGMVGGWGPLQESLVGLSGLGIAATKAATEATAKRASLENMVKNERSLVVSGEVFGLVTIFLIRRSWLFD